MSDEIYRKKSLKKMSSPESLNDYIQVSNPGVWMIIISVLVLLAGICAWGFFGRIETTIDTLATVTDNSVLCYVEEKDITSVKVGEKVLLGDVDGTLCEIGEKDKNGYCCTIKTDSDLSAGVYEAKIITESIKPISFILN